MKWMVFITRVCENADSRDDELREHVAKRSAELSPRIFAPFSQSVFYDGRRAGDEGLYPHPSPKIKAFWERGIILLKIRGDNSERSVPTKSRIKETNYAYRV